MRAMWPGQPPLHPRVPRHRSLLAWPGSRPRHPPTPSSLRQRRRRVCESACVCVCTPGGIRVRLSQHLELWRPQREAAQHPPPRPTSAPRTRRSPRPVMSTGMSTWRGGATGHEALQPSRGRARGRRHADTSRHYLRSGVINSVHCLLYRTHLDLGHDLEVKGTSEQPKVEESMAISGPVRRLLFASAPPPAVWPSGSRGPRTGPPGIIFHTVTPHSCSALLHLRNLYMKKKEKGT